MTLGLLVGGGSVAQFDRDSNSYDIIMQVPQHFRDNPETAGTILCPQRIGRDGAAVGGGIDLDQCFAGVHRAVQPAELRHDLGAAAARRDHRRRAAGDRGHRQDRCCPTASSSTIPASPGWRSQQGNTILIAFALAVVVIYLVLAAQFESFRDPFIIMMSVPLSIFGAIVPLNLGLGTLNIYTQVGLITLIGLITKHGILLVEFANQQREEHGLSRRDAIVASAKVRLRPILMTTAAMALGVVPLILAAGAGAAARYSMGLVIFSGVLSARCSRCSSCRCSIRSSRARTGCRQRRRRASPRLPRAPERRGTASWSGST